MDSQVSSNKVLVSISKLVSAILVPFFIPFLAFLFLFLFSYLRIMPLQYKFLVLCIIFCFTILMPLFSIFIFRKINRFSHVEMGERKRRYFPCLLLMISYIFCLLMMYRLNIPWYMVGIVLTCLVVQIVFLLANLKWKLSEHTGGMGAVIGGLISFSILFGYNPVWWLCALILVSGLLGSARIITGRHTLGEVIGGFVVGFACAMLVLNPATNFFFRFLLI